MVSQTQSSGYQLAAERNYCEKVQPTESAYADEAAARWPEQYAQSQARYGSLSQVERDRIAALGEAVNQKLAELLRAGEPAESALVQAEIAKHFDWVCAFWTPNRESYRGLLEMYVADQRFADFYERYQIGLAEFICDAGLVWADQNLS